MLNAKNHLLTNEKENLRILYDQYGAMLFGFLCHVLKDKKLAETQLIDIFASLSINFKSNEWEGSNNWCKLCRFAKSKLAELENNQQTRGMHFETVQPSTDLGLMQLSADQNKLFCAVYHHGKTVAEISKEINKTEASIRKSLQETFTKLREGVEN